MEAGFLAWTNYGELVGGENHSRKETSLKADYLIRLDEDSNPTADIRFELSYRLGVNGHRRNA